MVRDGCPRAAVPEGVLDKSALQVFTVHQEAVTTTCEIRKDQAVGGWDALNKGITDLAAQLKVWEDKSKKTPWWLF